MQIPAPLEKEFSIPWSDESFDITFRQANVGEDNERNSVIQNAFQDTTKSSEGITWTEVVRFHPEEVMMVGVRLTLESCSLKDGDKPFLTASMPKPKFQKAWRRLPTSIAGEMHKCVLEVNPDWDPQRAVEDETDSED